MPGNSPLSKSRQGPKEISKICGGVGVLKRRRRAKRVQLLALLINCKEESESLCTLLIAMRGPCARMKHTAILSWAFSHVSIQLSCKTHGICEALWIKQKVPYRTLKFRNLQCLHNTVLQKCLTFVSIPQDCPAKMFAKNCHRERLTGLLHKNVLPQCLRNWLTGVSHKSVFKKRLIRTWSNMFCQKIFVLQVACLKQYTWRWTNAVLKYVFPLMSVIPWP